MPRGTPKDHAGPHAPLKPEGDNIWHQSEAAIPQTSEILDPRTTPEYEIKYKQAVTTEDVFLGVSIQLYSKLQIISRKINT